MDMSQVGGYIRYDSFDPVIASVLIMFCFVLLIAIVMSSSKGSKSNRYRSLLTDMYVVGVIKKFATEDGIDLTKELKLFNKIQKQKGMSDKALDQVIEEELKEKIAKVTEANMEEAAKETSTSKTK
jgi:hypothetical protein